MAAAELVSRAVDRLDRRDRAGAYTSALGDIRGQIDSLVRPGFVTRAGVSRLRDLLRYLDAAGRRVERLPADPHRDAERQSVIDRLTRRYLDRLDHVASGPWGQSEVGAELAGIPWMIEELRVSLWAQQLGTATPVSETRVVRALERLGG